MGMPTRHRAYRSIAEMPGSRNLPGAAGTAGPRIARAQDEEQSHAGEESSKVGEPGYLAPGGLASRDRSPPRGQAGQELDQEPETEEENGRDAHDPDEETEDDDGQDVRPREEEQVGAQHARDGPACPDHGHGGRGAPRNLCRCRG